ncbi:unnamed protein product [Nippostrongylus brasiliensis]|uniref:DUF4604 domain-containing protein n=1 Tax=Nippostrongylus brasiliensis TaxID=27835 RepID=A0A0N4YBX1_NIPBR|nr:unnamed protein product [Nippostrongylus brasiliensis]
MNGRAVPGTPSAINLLDTIEEPPRAKSVMVKSAEPDADVFYRSVKKAVKAALEEQQDEMDEKEKEKEKEEEQKRKRRVDNIKPKEPKELNRKELMIALGAKRVESAYPTMDDINSDWDTKEDDKKDEEKKKPSKDYNKM